MNSAISWYTTSPYGKEDVCTKFSIDDIESAFVLTDIAASGQKYAFSCWLRSETDGSITIAGNEFISSPGVWSRVSLTFTASSEDFPIKFGAEGIYYIYQPQLETGTIPTDWTPAPEDAMDAITRLESKMGIDNESIWMEFTRTTEYINSTKDDIDGKFDQLYKHISFSADGIIISNGANTLTLRLDNTGISFLKPGAEKPFGFWDGNNFLTGNIEVRVEERAQFGNFAFVPRSDGSLSLLKVGG